jgi:hypothetical protein
VSGANFEVLDLMKSHLLVDGVRAGAKRLGRKRELSDRQKELCRIHREAPRPWVNFLLVARACSRAVVN